MGKPKKFMIKSVNFGTWDSPSRLVVEQFLKEHTHSSFSKLMRRLVLTEFAIGEEHKPFQKKFILMQVHEIGAKISALQLQKSALMAKYVELGGDENDQYLL